MQPMSSSTALAHMQSGRTTQSIAFYIGQQDLWPLHWQFKWATAMHHAESLQL